MVRLFIIILSTLLSLSASAQYHQIKFKKLGIPQGLSQNSANTIVQDKKGFIWVGTQDGLNKYNSYNFTVYKHERGDSTSIRDNFINALLIDKKGDLYVGASFGLDKLKSGTDEFEHISMMEGNKPEKIGKNIHALAEDSTGMIWVGTSTGLIRFNPKNKSVKIITHNPDDSTSLSDNNIKTIIANKKSLWVGTENGLSVCNLKTGKFTNYYNNPSDQNSITGNTVNAIAEDSSDIFWIGTSTGLNQFDTKISTFIRFQNDKKNYLSISSNDISSLCVDKNHELWVGTSDFGLNRLDKQSGYFYHLTNKTEISTSISNNTILSLFEDQTEVLWVGSGGGGINLFDEKPVKFEHIYGNTNTKNNISSNDIWAIYADTQSIYIGATDGGLNIINLNGTVTVHKHDPDNSSSISSDRINSFVKDGTGNFWIATDKDLDKFDIKKKKFTHYISAQIGRPVNLRSLIQDKNGLLWGGDTNGLIRFNPENGRIDEWKNVTDDSTSITSGQVYSIMEDHLGEIWVGTESGLNLFNASTNNFKQFCHDPNNINTICYPAVQSLTEDQTGRIWVGTGLGLSVYDRDSKQFKSFFEADGLPNTCIYNILEDNNGYFWMSTNQGLSRFDPIKVYNASKNEVASLFRNYGQQDGLQSNEFNLGTAFKAANGEMFFGGINGFNRFFPEKVTDNPYIPSVEITDFKILDKSVNLSKFNGQILLNSAQNVFSFEYAALDFTNPGNNQFAYMLEGFDSDWIYSGTRHFVSYTNLDAGEYVFKVRGSNNDGIWNNEGASIKLLIIPPFWKTKAAYFFYILSIIALIYLIIKWRAFRLESEKRLLEKLVTAKTSELKSSYEQLRKSQDQLIHTEKMRVIGQLASGIAHDINNILSIILGSSEILLNNANDNVTLKRINTISKAASDGATIIRRLQEFSKHEYSQIMDPVDLNELLVETIEMTSYLVVDKKKKENVTISFKTEFGQIPLIKGNASELRSVITNIIINAVDSFGKSGNIYIKTILKDPEFIEISFRDEGKGIEKDILDRIFEPFFSTKGTRGSGLGLSQVYGIISRHNGNINVESEYGKGTLIKIQLPVTQMAEIVSETNTTDLQTTPHLINENPNINQKVILIVEDESEIRGIYNNILLDMGHDPVFAASGEEGIEKWKSRKFDMIISDIGLPGISGWDFIKSVRSENDDIPILVITGWGNEITSDRVSSNHINKIITKPFKFDQFINYVNELLNS